MYAESSSRGFCPKICITYKTLFLDGRLPLFLRTYIFIYNTFLHFYWLEKLYLENKRWQQIKNLTKTIIFLMIEFFED